MQKLLAAGIPIDEQGRGLFDVNIKYGFCVTPIGGKVEEDDQDSASAAEREGEEEFSIRMKVRKLIGTYPTNSKGEGAFPVDMFICNVDTSDARCEDGVVLPNEPQKSLHAVWLTLRELFILSKRNFLAPNLDMMLHDLRWRYLQAMGNLRGKLPAHVTLGHLLHAASDMEPVRAERRSAVMNRGMPSANEGTPVSV